ncbi:ankyrin repeat domain-containing protein SOWAHC-like [Lacerta agilis]|uniref:ankyrin repeat domain-containing protein SOWAHC-like n=1 Tax=Lacerta agilis TaxID=80427 RepID=UPI001419FCB8|nr:ankyrin repeat domain-containing protein SOWAHC-like [Lacerta agilis]
MSAPQILVTVCDDGAPPESDRDGADDGGGNGPGVPSPVALEPLEKEWLQAAAGGHVATLSHLLQQDPSLASKKDFTSFTALHWAAKHGKEELVTLLLGAGADINMKAGGYTPLHIAALHGHRQLMESLIWTHGANQDIRDYSGRLAKHYLCVETPEGAPTPPQLSPMRGERSRNRKLACLLLPRSSHPAQRRWGSANDLAEEEEEEEPQETPQHLASPGSYRAVRKFSR